MNIIRVDKDVYLLRASIMPKIETEIIYHSSELRLHSGTSSCYPVGSKIFDDAIHLLQLVRRSWCVARCKAIRELTKCLHRACHF
jgi:hypothetical protein